MKDCYFWALCHFCTVPLCNIQSQRQKDEKFQYRKHGNSTKKLRTEEQQHSRWSGPVDQCHPSGY